MIAIRHGPWKWMLLCAALGIALVFAVRAGGCGNPGEDTVKVDPKVAARLGKHLGIPPAAYGRTLVEPPGIKGRARKNAAVK
jgi:hypothetical protein